MIKAVLSAGGLLAAVALAVVLLGGIPKDKVNGSLSKIQTVGLTEQSIEIVGPTETAFDSLMSKQSQKTKSRDLRALKSSSVFVINKSGQSIAAMSVNWELVQPDGVSVSHATAHQGGLGIASEGGPPQLMEDIAPNGNRLFSLLDLPDSNQGFGYRTGGGPDKARQLAESVKVIVSIDGVLFADGTFCWPGPAGLLWNFEGGD